MKTSSLVLCASTAALLVSSQVSSRADNLGFDGLKFKCDVGLSYMNGANDVNNKLKASINDNNTTLNTDGSILVFPVGLELNPRVQFNNGIGVGLSLGPTEFAAYEIKTYYSSSSYSSSSKTHFSYSIPIGPFVQYDILHDSNWSPFVRGGVKFPVAGGDDFKSSSAGLFGQVGVQFFRQNHVGMGFDVGYDASKITIRAGSLGPDRKATPVGFNAGIFVTF
jgi:hypothetical protein